MKIRNVGKKEGFFDSKPKCRSVPWKGHRVFVTALIRLEFSLKLSQFCRTVGCHKCRLQVGNSVYKHKGWMWPTGLYHYVKVHNVKPSDEFIRFVLKENK